MVLSRLSCSDSLLEFGLLAGKFAGGSLLGGFTRGGWSGSDTVIFSRGDG
jgi:hypothetical protein